MNKDFKSPPQRSSSLTPPEKLAHYFSEIIGTSFVLTGKTRTDGSRIRKLIASVLEKYPLPDLALKDQFEIVPPKNKGVPKVTRQFIDTYIVTTGTSYNLQVWNRIPAADSLLIKYESGESLKCTDVRFVLVKIDTEKDIISSVVILTPDYIEKKFGRFGKPTIKNQLLISKKVRADIYESADKILSFPDSSKLSKVVKHNYEPPKLKMTASPEPRHMFSIELLREIVAKKLIGFRLNAGATKNRGQALEKKVLELLGYELKETDLLHGAFPDIRNQLLEVKVQDSPTIDLGQFSPENEGLVIGNLGLTTYDTRYLIALTDPQTETIKGIILSPGKRLGELFSYVSDESYKCQRAIPMIFFDKHKGKAIFNPT